MKKKLALFVAWALLAAGVVVGSSSPASAQIEGEPFPFTANFGGYATGTGLHLDVIQPDDTQRVLDVDLGFSGASVDSDDFDAPVVSLLGQTVQPHPSSPGLDNIDEHEAYGQGAGAEVLLGAALPQDACDVNASLPLVLVGCAEAASHPPVRSDGPDGADPGAGETLPTEFDSGLVRESLTIDQVDPLLFLRALDGAARANFNPNFCLPGTIPGPENPLGRLDLSDGRMAYGEGFVAQAQLVNQGELLPIPGQTEPLIEVGDQEESSQGIETKSFTYLIPNPLPAGAPESDRTFAVVSETRGDTASVAIGGTDPITGEAPLTVHVIGTWTLRIIATGLGEPEVQFVPPSLVSIEPAGGPPTEVIPAAPTLTVSPDGFGGTATGDVLRLAIPPGVPHLADLAIGHMEVSAQVPEGGVNCPGSVEILKDFSEDATGETFEFTIECTDGENGPVFDINPDDPASNTQTVTIDGTVSDGTDAPDASTTFGPIPSGAVCEVTEDPPSGWRSTQTSADPPPIVANQFSQVRFLNEPRPTGPGTLVIEKFVPADNAAMREFTYEFSIDCTLPNGDPVTNLPSERHIRPADLPAREDNPATPEVEDPAYGDTRGTGSFDSPVVDLPDGTTCTVTEEDDPDFDPTDPTDDPVFRSQPAQTIEIVGEAENVVVFRNDPPPPGFGNLIVVKDAPDDPDAQATNFDFSVTCPNGVVNEAFDRDIVGDGESEAVIGIAEGTVCTVHEDVPPGFVVDQNDQQVTIQQNTTHRVTFVNRRPDGAGQLVVTKDAPDDAQDVEFDFTADCVTPGPFAGAAIVENIKITGDGSSDPIRLPPGTECTVHEFTEPGFASQPDITVTVLSPPTVTEVLFVNVRSSGGSLTVTKDAPADAQDVIFTFVIHCPSLFNEPFARSVVGDGVSEPVVGIPAGTLCTVTEPTVNGFVPQADQQILIAGGANNVTFVNTRGGPVVGGVTFSRQPAAPAVAANSQPRYTG